MNSVSNSLFRIVTMWCIVAIGAIISTVSWAAVAATGANPNGSCEGYRCAGSGGCPSGCACAPGDRTCGILS